MIESERNKLENKESEYLSIGITQDGAPRGRISVPWVESVHAFNMKIPDVYISPDDLLDEELMSRISSYNVIGCYIWAPLSDYSFLARFKDVWDIYIKNGDAISDLSFLSELYECRMLYLQNAKLKNLDVIVEVKKNSTMGFSCLRCIGLDNCEVEDLSVFETEKVHFSEFLVWKPEGADERDRWNVVSANPRRYYEFSE